MFNADAKTNDKQGSQKVADLTDRGTNSISFILKYEIYYMKYNTLSS